MGELADSDAIEEVATHIAPANMTLTVDPRNGGCDGGALDGAKRQLLWNRRLLMQRIRRSRKGDSGQPKQRNLRSLRRRMSRPTVTLGRSRRLNIAPANLTLTAIRGTVVVAGGALDCASSDDFGNDACRCN